MKNSIKYFVVTVSLFLFDCIGPDCVGPDSLQEEPGNIFLRFTASVDSVQIVFESRQINPNKIILVDSENPGFGDTISIRFYGKEEYYNKRLRNSVIVTGSQIRIKHLPLDSNSVYYTHPMNNIEVLQKQACSPVDPGFYTDSIVVERRPGRLINLVPSQIEWVTFMVQLRG